MQIAEEDYLMHYGILRRSGRYPWGSGKDPNQRSQTFLDMIDEHKKAGLSDKEIAALYHEPKKHPFTVSDLKETRTKAIHVLKQDQIRTAQALKDKGMGFSEIGRQMNANESTVRSLLAPGRQEKLAQLQNTADMLRRQVDSLADNEILDVGSQVERDLPLLGDDMPNIGIAKDKFNTALSMLKEEGYKVHTFSGPQVGTGERTNYKVLTKPGMTAKEAFANRSNLRLISEKTNDDGRTYRDLSFKKPLSINSKRVAVRYKEDGGADADGIIYVRPGKKDISLGQSHYAQVRIAVGDTHYLKGVAIYKNDLPKGVDLLFNTNKSNTGNKLDALKPLKRTPEGEVDWQNPFGALPKIIGGQIVDAKGNVSSAMNKLSEQGDWNEWSRTLSRQVLSKQEPPFAKSQLDLTYERKLNEFNEINALTNPVIKKKLLETFSEEVDSSAVHLKAANLPRQANKLLLPVVSLKPNEVYAPTFKHGETVALIRYPHAGRFEIPVLRVNNRNKEAKALLDAQDKTKVIDAIGIHPKVAEHLSGADFDGDAVVVIPNNNGLIKRDAPLEGLKGFDPQKYKVKTPEEDPQHGWITMDENQTQQQMGKVTNLIADMTIKGAASEDLTKAVRHSMVVIDAEKHNLDWKASERDNTIIALKKKYQGVTEKGQPRGASTLISRARAREDVPKRKAAPVYDENKNRIPGLARLGPKVTVNTKTGEKVFVKTEELNQHGKLSTFRSRKLAETTDAFTLVSDHGGHEIEKIYAEHSNRLKALANQVRLAALAVEPTPYSPSAKEVYSKEVQQLNADLNFALQNKPRERLAQVVANQIMAERRRANPHMSESEKKKIRGQALERARYRTGASKTKIPITDREWQAIQAGAISASKLRDILNNTDLDKVKELATPHKQTLITPVMKSRATSMLGSGATYEEVADALGVSVSTLERNLKAGGD